MAVQIPTQARSQPTFEGFPEVTKNTTTLELRIVDEAHITYLNQNNQQKTYAVRVLGKSSEKGILYGIRRDFDVALSEGNVFLKIELDSIKNYESVKIPA